MTTHVFIVNRETLPVHLEFLFAGTGAGGNEEHDELCADISRLRPGDRVIFYLEGVGFFGVFRVPDRPDYIFQDGGDYLLERLQKKLIYRAFVEPEMVYPLGVSEWEALDLLPVYAQEVIWSLIYRKLRGNRGCTPITLEESTRLIGMLERKNTGGPLSIRTGETVSYDASTQSLTGPVPVSDYCGPTVWTPPCLSKVIEALAYRPTKACESWLEAYITGNYGKDEGVDGIVGRNPTWLGNQVACGVGMQKIDVLSICEDGRHNRVHRVVELKREPAAADIVKQLERYIEWCKYYLKGAVNTNIVPVVVARSLDSRYSRASTIDEHRRRLQAALDELDGKCIAQPVQYYDFDAEGAHLRFRLDRGDVSAALLTLH